MTKDTTKEAAVAAEALLWLDDWFDAIEGRGSGSGAAGFIETMLEEELSEALSRPRYEVGASQVRTRRPPRRLSACATGIASPDADGHVWQDADRRATRSVDRRGRQDARMAEAVRCAPTSAAPGPPTRLIAGAYLAGTNTRRVRRALNAVLAGPVGKDVVSRVWRKNEGRLGRLECAFARRRADRCG